MDVVRESIFAGELRPGERIVEGKLASELGVGISAVREGLQKLEHAGLVVRYPNRGTYITQLTETEVQQMYRLRAELEAFSAKLALLKRPDPAEVGQLQVYADQMKLAAQQHDYAKYFECDITFHGQLCRIAGDPFLEKCLSSLTVPLIGFVLIRLKQDPMLSDFAHLAEQHQKIVDAFGLSDPEEAAEAVRKIILGFGQRISGKLHLS